MGTLFFSCRSGLFGGSFGFNLGALVASGRIALLARAAASVLLGLSLNDGLFCLSLGALRVGVTAAAYHGDGSQCYNERKNLFHDFKRLKLVVL